MSSNPTITLRFSQAVVQAAQRLGVALPDTTLGKLDPGQDRVPLSAQDAIWQNICAASQDPLIGLRLGLEIQVGHLDSAGLMLMSCDTLGDAVDTLLEYFPIISEGSHFDTRLERGGLRLRYVPGYNTALEVRAEAVLGCLVHLSRWITGERFNPASVHLRHAQRDNASRYASLLGCPVHFDCEDYSLLLSDADLLIPLIQANAAMREHLRKVADEMLASLTEQSLAAQVEALIRAHPHWGKERVAEQLGISGRHLNRRLANEASSFKLLRDAALYQMAEQRLRTDQRLADIAEALGFSDESAFAKAFRRWAGESPARFRERT